MTEEQQKKPEYESLIKEEKLIMRTILKLNSKLQRTNDNNKKYDLINKIEVETNKMKKINVIANYLDRHYKNKEFKPTIIAKRCISLMTNELAFKRALKINKKRLPKLDNNISSFDF